VSELLRLTGVSKRYARGRRDVRALAEIDFDLQAGEFACVLGSRRAGKSTLLRIAAGMESPDSGQVRFDGLDLVGLSDARLSRLLGAQIAWAGKSGPGMPMQMLDYVAMPLLASRRAGRLRGLRAGRRDAYARARAALERVGAQPCAEQRWESMSDWERALAELAQAIAAGPRLLLIDDLTDTLGIRETDELTALVRELSREMSLAVLMSVSDAPASLWADRVLSLAGGKLTEGPREIGANVIEFPEPGSIRRAERGSS
jgi:ABC-type cobalamin/Fe3+-siderophores transport system ATPase subunit